MIEISRVSLYRSHLTSAKCCILVAIPAGIVQSSYLMVASTSFPKASLQQIIDQVLSTKRITRSDQARFMAIALRESSLSLDDQRQIARVFDALKAGFVKVVD